MRSPWGFTLCLFLLAITTLLPCSATEVANQPTLQPQKANDYRTYVEQFNGMTETSYNRGPVIDIMNRNAGVPLKSPYCASGVRHVLKACNLTTRTRMTARAKDYVGPHSISALDVWKGKAKIPDDCVGVMTRKGGGHIYFKISQSGDRLSCYDFNSTPDGLKGSQYDGRWSGFKTRSIKQTCSPLNAFRTIAFTPIFTA